VLNPDCTFTPSTVPDIPYEPVLSRVKASARCSKVIEAPK
jgi:hypothetical protein